MNVPPILLCRDCNTLEKKSDGNIHLTLDRREEHVTLMLGLSAQRNIFTSIYLELSEKMHIFAVELLSIRHDDK